MKPMVSQKVLDKVGVCAGAICAIHCLLTGVAMGLLAVSGFAFLGNPWFEGLFLGIAVVVGLFALWHGIKRHHSWIPATVFVLGLSCIAFSFLVGHGHLIGQESGHSGHGHSHSHGPSPVGTALAVAGGLLVATFHLLNHKLQHRNCSCGKQQAKSV